MSVASAPTLREGGAWRALESHFAEITEQALRVLTKELGVADTARFINQFTMGSGDYTRDRDEILGDLSLDEVLAEIKKARPQGG